jgi:subtilisin family serine protease
VIRTLRIARTVGTVLGLATLVSCGQDKGEIKFRAVEAPQSENQTGWVVDLSDKNYSDKKTEELLQEIESFGGRVRSINPAHGLFEIFDISRAQLERIAPADVIQKNKFWRKKNRQETNEMLESYCPQVPGAPKMELKASTATRTLKAEEPEIFKRDAQKITFNVTMAGTPTNYRWEVYGPSTSAFNGNKFSDSDATLTPDELGEYNVFLLVKLANNKACWRRFLIGVTGNAAYNGPGSEKLQPVDTRLAQFPHLAALGLKNAWATTEGAKTKIAILDTGVDYNHPDLAGNMALNLADQEGDSKDNDMNKFTDDYLGWDFVNNDNSPYDDEMHGTHVAGLAASLVGVAPKSSVIAVKVLGPFGGDMATLAGGIYYAVDRGAKIINMSLGGSSSSNTLAKAMNYAEAHGVLVVVAAGNDAEDIDLKPTYPASLTNSNILVVAATDLTGALTDYTNVGPIAVDVACPGGSDADGGLLSAFYTNRLSKKYVRAQGTSMASPLVAGVAALVLSANPNFKAQDIKNLIITRGTERSEYQGKVGSTKLVSAANLFTQLGPR